MKIEKIITKRFYNSYNEYHLVWEWEDVFKRILNAELCIDWNCSALFNRNLFFRILKKLYNHLPLTTKKPALVIEMDPIGRNTEQNNKGNIIPWIVDFYLHTDEELKQFYRKFDKHKLILISSLSVFEFLQRVGCPIPIAHLPLSISDKYRIDTNTCWHKEFDVILAGRQNPILLNFLNTYREAHPNLSVVSCKKENGHYNYYNQHGQFFGNADTREGLMSLMKKSRVGLYSGKGMDQDYIRVSDSQFSQITPRLFEFLVTGNHVIARYEDNSDSRYYELPDMFPCINTYAAFEKEMDKALHSEVNRGRYCQYLEKHYTSTRVEKFVNLVKDI